MPPLLSTCPQHLTRPEGQCGRVVGHTRWREPSTILPLKNSLSKRHPWFTGPYMMHHSSSMTSETHSLGSTSDSFSNTCGKKKIIKQVTCQKYSLYSSVNILVSLLLFFSFSFIIISHHLTALILNSFSSLCYKSL